MLQNLSAFDWLKTEFRSNFDFMLAAIEHRAEALVYAAEELQVNYDFLSKAVEKNARVLQFMSKHLRLGPNCT